MNNACFFFLIASLMLAGTAAGASTFSIIKVQTVTTDDSLDVIRNPALLASQKEANSLGLLFFASPYNAHNIQAQAYQTSTILSARADDYRFRTGGFCMAYSGKISGGAIGFAIDTENSRPTEYYNYKDIFTGTDNININSALVKGSYSTVSPDFVFSFGKTIIGNNAIGLKLTLGYSLLNDDFSFTSATSDGFLQRHHAAKKIEGFSSEAALSYQYRDSASQAGIMLRSGRFKLDTTKIYYTHAEFGPSLFFAGSLTDPRQFRYDEGFSIIAGGYRRMGQFVAVALEGEYRVPISLGEKRLRYDAFTGFYGIRVNSAVNNKGLYGLRGGIEILPQGPVTISAGAGMRTESRTKNARYMRESKTSEEYNGALGIDFKFTEKIRLSIGTVLSYTRERTHTASSYFGARSEDISAAFYDLNTCLGMSFGF
jgi:hypothetical protein